MQERINILISSSFQEGDEVAKELAFRLKSQDVKIIKSISNYSDFSRDLNKSVIDLIYLYDKIDFAVFIIKKSDCSFQNFSNCNVFFELGYFLGKLGTSGVLILLIGSDIIKSPISLNNVHQIRIPTYLNSQDVIVEEANFIKNAIENIKLNKNIKLKMSDQPVFPTCYIIYSKHDDIKFVTKLSNDLNKMGIRCSLL
jgi:hypothetical protein